MKYARVLFAFAALLCAAHPSAAQQPFDWPFQPGDRVVIGGAVLRLDDPLYPEAFDLYPMIANKIGIPVFPQNRQLLTNFGAGIDGWDLTNYFGELGFGVTDSGRFAAAAFSGCYEILPISPPQSDTLTMYAYDQNGIAQEWRYVTNARVFDTTVFNTTVHAYSADILDIARDLVARVTICDKYWLLRYESTLLSYTLNRFMIGSEYYNIGPFTLEFPEPCTELGFMYRELYSQISPPNSYSTVHEWVVGDTLIEGETFYFLNPNNLDFYPHIPTAFPIRKDSVNIICRINNTERSYLPYSGYLGDYNAPYWFTALDTINFQEKRLAFSFFYDSSPVDGDYFEATYLSGIGLSYLLRKNPWPESERHFNLISFTPCVVGIESPLPSLPFWQSVVYPSPARDEITIAIQHAATAAPLSGTLLITDALGRTALALPWDDISERSTLAIPIAGFAPGVYYYRLIGSEAWLAGQFVVGR